jgi:SsrA-binding protein
MELAKNRKAFFDYEVLDKFEAGMVLHGYEVKAIRNKLINLKGGHVSIRNGEAFLDNVLISPYQPKNQPEENGKRKRKLLLQRKEIDKLEHQLKTPGITIVPLKVFIKNNRLKLQIGVCRGKKQHDKRNTIKNRETDREIRRRMK